MIVILSVAITASFLIGLSAGWLFLLPFNKLIVNTFSRAIVVSIIALAPVGAGLVAVGFIADLTASDRHLLGVAFLIGTAISAIWGRLKDARRKR